MSLDKEQLLGYRVDTRSLEGCVESICRWILGDSKGAKWLACINPHAYVVGINDLEFSRALQNTDWLVPDGVGIVLASRFLGGEIRKRVTGSDIFREVNSALNAHGGRSVFLLGSTHDTLARVHDRMARDFPQLRVAGTYSPPFKHMFTETDNAAMISAIERAKADVLWVAMTAPKQEKWIFANVHRLDVKFAGAVGAVFDFYSGKIARSHPSFQKLGLEWLPRLLKEPRRLWRRMFVSAPIFVWHAMRERMRTDRNH